MKFDNHLFVSLSNNNWVICRFIKSAGFFKHPSNEEYSFQKFTLEGVVTSDGTKNDIEVCGSDIVSIVPIQRVPLLITICSGGSYYETIRGDLHRVNEARTRNGVVIRGQGLSTRFILDHENGKGYYEELLSKAPNSVNIDYGDIIDGMIDRMVRIDKASVSVPNSFVYSVEPFYTHYRIHDVEEENKRMRSPGNKYIGALCVDKVVITVDYCYKKITIATEVIREYETRNFTGAEHHHLTYQTLFPTRKACDEFLQPKLIAFGKIKDSTIIESRKSIDIVQFIIHLNETDTHKTATNAPVVKEDVTEALGIDSISFTDSVTESSSWNW